MPGRWRAAWGLSVLLLIGAGLVAVPTVAAAAPVFEMPFPCGQQWFGATYQDDPEDGDHGGPGNYFPLDFNWGSDAYADLGKTVVASADGTMTIYRVSSGGTSNSVLITHAGGWSTYYSHLDSFINPATGQTITSPVASATYDIKQGQPLGTVGKSGANSPHLHYEQRLNGTPAYIAFSGVQIGSAGSQDPGYAINPDPYKGNLYTSRNCPYRVVPYQTPTVAAMTNGWFTELPIGFSYTIKNSGTGPATMPLVIVAVRDPYGVNRDVLCSCGRNVVLAAGQTFKCRASSLFPWPGTYTYFAAWQDTGGGWHYDMWPSKTFRLASSVVRVSGSQSLSAPYGRYSGVPITFRYQIKNLSPYAVVGMPWVTNGVRNPAGGNRDAGCTNGRNVTLNPGQTFSCTATRTFWSNGTYKYWPAWQGPSQAWHGPSELWPEQYFTLSQPIVRWVTPTATVGGTAGSFPRRVTFAFTVRNVASGSVTLPLVFVALRDPSGKNIDVPCNLSRPVTVGAGSTYRCTTTTYVWGRGTYTYWPSWRDPEGVFHDLSELWSMRYFTISS